MDLRTKRRIDSSWGARLLPAALFVSALKRRFRSNPTPSDPETITFLKLLGGGSLVIAMPAFLGIRNRYPNSQLTLITTSTLEPFAHSLGIFDRVLAVDDRSIIRLLASASWVWSKVWRSQWFVDLEVHSRLAAVLTGFTAARRSFGFSGNTENWKQSLYTDLLLFTPLSPVYLSYDQMAHRLDAKPATLEACKQWILNANFPPSPDPNLGSKIHSKIIPKISIGHACSDLAPERMLPTNGWIEWIGQLLQNHPELRDAEIILLGGAEDASRADDLIFRCRSRFPRNIFRNESGRRSLVESLEILRSSTLFLGIDSALLHYARLLQVPNESAWGPTHPATLLRPMPSLNEKTHYKKIACSPCVHITEIPSCSGNNICMQKLFVTPRAQPQKSGRSISASGVQDCGAASIASPNQ